MTEFSAAGLGRPPGGHRLPHRRGRGRGAKASRAPGLKARKASLFRLRWETCESGCTEFSIEVLGSSDKVRSFGNFGMEDTRLRPPCTNEDVAQ